MPKVSNATKSKLNTQKKSAFHNIKVEMKEEWIWISFGVNAQNIDDNLIEKIRNISKDSLNGEGKHDFQFPFVPEKDSLPATNEQRLEKEEKFVESFKKSHPFSKKENINKALEEFREEEQKKLQKKESVKITVKIRDNESFHTYLENFIDLFESVPLTERSSLGKEIEKQYGQIEEQPPSTLNADNVERNSHIPEL